MNPDENRDFLFSVHFVFWYFLFEVIKRECEENSGIETLIYRYVIPAQAYRVDTSFGS
jgi:hypothetical protein